MEDLTKSEDRQAVVMTPIDKAMIKYEITDNSKELIRTAMDEFYKKAAEWETKIKAIKVTNELQVADMKMARVGRLALKQVRVDAEHKKDELKAESLKYNNAVQAVYNLIKNVCEPLETYALEQEEFAERKAKRERDERFSTRTKLLQPYSDHVVLGGVDLGIITEELFLDILDKAMDAKADFDAKQKEAEAQALAKKEADEKEKERLKKENEELKKTVTSQGAVVDYLKKELIEEPRKMSYGSYASAPKPKTGYKMTEAETLEYDSLSHIHYQLKEIFVPEGGEKIVNVKKVTDAIDKLCDSIEKQMKFLAHQS